MYLCTCTSSSESKPKKQVVTFANVWFSDWIDNDGDYYPSYARLNFDLDVSRGSISVYVKVGVRVTDPVDTSDYLLYFESAAFGISGATTDDAVYIAVGDPNTELPQAGFDFVIQVFNEADQQLLAELSSANDDNLDNVLTEVYFEQSATDAGLVIYDAYWSNEVDNDKDGYVSQSNLVVDVNVNIGTSADVYLVYYAKESTSGTYVQLASSEVYPVTGNSSGDALSIPVNNFAHNYYDFRVEAYYDGGYYLEDSVDPSSDADLNDVQLELTGEDTANQTGWIWYDDGVYEDGYSLTSPSYRCVRFNKPRVAVNCWIKEIYLYVTSRNDTNNYYYAKAQFKVWDSFNAYPDAYIYNGTTVVNINYDGDNYYSANGTMNIDVSAYSSFYVGYYQMYGYGFYIGADTSAPDSRSFYYNNSSSSWIQRTDLDYAVRIYVEYTLTKNKDTAVTQEEWLEAQIGN
jgi:hypothetical protein